MIDFTNFKISDIKENSLYQIYIRVFVLHDSSWTKETLILAFRSRITSSFTRTNANETKEPSTIVSDDLDWKDGHSVRNGNKSVNAPKTDGFQWLACCYFC